MNSSRILVVDDEPLNLDIIQAYLADEPYQLSLYSSSTAAWDHLQTSGGDYDLVILDRLMPCMDGIELLLRLKADPHLKHLPVIMQTSVSAPEQVAVGLRAGAFYYLTKPYDPTLLVSIVRSALSDVRVQLSLAHKLDCCFAALSHLQTASFELKKQEEILPIATLLSHLAESPETVISGIIELMRNAVEHGNLGLTYQEKKQHILNDSLEQELSRRSTLPEFHAKKVSLSLLRRGEEVILNIRDEGLGFDWAPYLDISTERAFDPNGRGIALSRMISFTSLTYLGCGNEVQVTFPAAQPSATLFLNQSS